MRAQITRLVHCLKQIVRREPPANVQLPLEVDRQIKLRAFNLWEQAGCPLDRRDRFLDFARHEFYETNGKWYRRDGNTNITEALGFIKDWVTSLIQLQIAAIGAIGIFVSFKDFPRIALSPAEWFFLALAIVLFLYSIRTGLTILNALPGAMQRVPANASAQGADVFSIANENDSRTLDVLSKPVRNSFLAGMASFVAFVIVRAALSTPLPRCWISGHFSERACPLDQALLAHAFLVSRRLTGCAASR